MDTIQYRPLFADKSLRAHFDKLWGLVMHKKTLFLLAITAGFTGMSACQDAELSSYECPEANQLATGVSVRCGDDTVTGTMNMTGGEVPSCSTDGQTDCVAASPFKVVDTTTLTPSRIKSGVTIAGVVGNIISEGVGACTVDGETQCYAGDDFLGAKISTLANKLAVGKSVGEVQGTAVLSEAAACTSNAQVGCLTSSSYVAMRNDLATTCLLNNGGALTLTAESNSNWQFLRDKVVQTPTEAQGECANLGSKTSARSESAWRLPTQKEAMAAFVSGEVARIYGNSASQSIGELEQFPIWTTSALDQEDEHVWIVDLATGETTPVTERSWTNLTIFLGCVRK